MSGTVTNAVVAIGSEMYPEGTYEGINIVANEAHYYMECANNGNCDRQSGECQCFDGFEGSTCQRQACPGNCNGHGTCMSISEFATKAGGTLFHRGVLDNVNGATTYNLWDENSIFGCKCDPWYTGADCSLRRCKVGLDPLYDDNQNTVYETFTVRAVANNGVGFTEVIHTASSYIKLRVFDYWGESYITEKIVAYDNAVADNAAAIETALEKLPNKAFADVTCAEAGTGTGNLKVFADGKYGAAYLGINVICELTSNPGSHRLPEIAESWIGTSATVKAVTQEVYVTSSPLRGEDFDWANTRSTGTYTIAASAVVLVGTGDSLPTGVSAALKLVKVNRQYLVVFADTSTKFDVAWPYDAITTAATIYISSATVVKGLTTLVSGNIGSTTLTFTAAATDATVGLWIFVHNQLYKINARDDSAFTVTIDRPFYGKGADGTPVSGATDTYYVITPPTDAYRSVDECSMKGLCDRTSGLCSCFKGYTNDNCDTQNMLAL